MKANRRYLYTLGRALIVTLLTAAVGQQAVAEVRLSGETGGNYSVNVLSWRDIPFRSVVRQQYDFSCGSAAVATLLSYHYQQRTPERAVFAKMWERGDRDAIRKVGFSMLDMKQYLDGMGYPAEGFRVSLDQLKQAARPSIVLLNLKGFKHFVVIKGIKGDRVLVGDPMLGLTQYSLRDFRQMWNGVALAIMQEPRQAAPKFNLAGDWGPWATAPLEEAGLHVTVGDMTTHLPPEYQLTSEMLLDIRVGTTAR